MTKHIRTAPPVPVRDVPPSQQQIAEIERRVNQNRANAALDAAAPLRYVPSMGKRLKAAEGLSDAARKAAHAALVEWGKP